MPLVIVSTNRSHSEPLAQQRFSSENLWTRLKTKLPSLASCYSFKVTKAVIIGAVSAIAMGVICAVCATPPGWIAVAVILTFSTIFGLALLLQRKGQRKFDDLPQKGQRTIDDLSKEEGEILYNNLRKQIVEESVSIQKAFESTGTVIDEYTRYNIISSWGYVPNEHTSIWSQGSRKLKP